jgi:hypothetical protein
MFGGLCLALVCAGARAGTIMVTSIADSGPGTLREALGAVRDGDRIDASGISGTILLTSGELLITNHVSIVGPGPENLIVDGNAAGRVFATGWQYTIAISGLTITNGKAREAGHTGRDGLGGGIYSHSTLTLSNCTVSGNAADYWGGAIYNECSTLLVSDCLFVSNSAGWGGAISTAGRCGEATVTLIASTLTANSSTIGGGIYNNDSVVTVSNCVISGNDGGGIYNRGGYHDATTTIAGSLLSGNRADYGGGVCNQGSSGNTTVTIVNCTLATKSGGILNRKGAVAIGSTILNGFKYVKNIVNDGGTVTSIGYNLSDDSGSGFLTATGDQINTDPKLGPLQDNGGPTFTRALLVCSPAIDQGKNFAASTTDQRGDGFTRTFDDPDKSNATGGDGTDIGALEAQAPVLDTVAPTIACPADIVANASTPDGAVVSFVPTASDNCSAVSVTSSPASGSVFAIGANTVTCTAIDSSVNSASCAFTVRVKGATEQIADLIEVVRSFNLKSATANSLIAKLQAAASVLNNGNSKGACGNLADFISLANAQKDKKQLTAAQASLLVGEAARIRAVLGC